MEIAVSEVPPSITGTMSDWAYAPPIPNVNVATPEFPAVAIGFVRNPDNAAYDLIRFSNQKDFAHYRAMHIGVVRVIRTADDLKHVHDPILRELYIFAGESLEAEQDLTREELVGRINLATLLANATPYEETIMGTSVTEGTSTTPQATNSTEAKAAEKAKEKAKKAQEKADAKKERESKRADGVIGNIKKALESTEGTTAEEILNQLVAKFPDRTREGMGSTVKIQFSRLAKTTGRAIDNAKIKGRGRVYKFADKGAIPGEVDTGEKAPETPATPVSETPAAAAPTAGASGETAETTLAEKRAAKAKK